MTIEHLTSWLNEPRAWQLLRDMATALDGNGPAPRVHPAAIDWTGTAFRPDSEAQALPLPEAFTPPELSQDTPTTASAVWSLGATVFTLVMGVPPFCGRGGAGQHADSPVPVMPPMRHHPDRAHGTLLGTTVAAMLSHDPAQRPSPAAIAATARQWLDQDTLPPRQRRPEATARRRHADDFWPERFVLILAFLFSLLTASAQTLDNEMQRLVKTARTLRTANESTYNAVVRQLHDDAEWTPMNELGSVQADSELPNARAANTFALNRALTRADQGRKEPAVRGDMLNGEDPRYAYSLYERTLRPRATATYTLRGRAGQQTFVIVPAATRTATLRATVSRKGQPAVAFRQQGDILVAACPWNTLRADETLTLTVTNNTGQPQPFVVINHNTRK